VVLRYSFWSRLLALPREEFRISKLTFHSDLRRRAASRLALPCSSSLIYDLLNDSYFNNRFLNLTTFTEQMVIIITLFLPH